MMALVDKALLLEIHVGYCSGLVNNRTQWFQTGCFTRKELEDKNWQMSFG